MDRRNKLIVPSQKLVLSTRRQFMKSIAALSAGAFVGGGAIAYLGSSGRIAQAGGPSPLGEGPWCNTENPGYTWCYNYDNHYSYQTRVGDLHTDPNGGEASWSPVVINGETYHEATCENQYDATDMIYWDNFVFDIPRADTVRLPAVHLRIRAESWADGGAGPRTQPKNGNGIKLSTKVDDFTWPRSGGWIGAPPPHLHSWAGTLQPFIKGGRSWKENLWNEPCDAGDPGFSCFQCCGSVTAACPNGGTCECDTQALCDNPPWGPCGSYGYKNPGYWGMFEPGQPAYGYLTVSQVENSRFGISIQVVAKQDGQYFRIRTNPGPEIRVYWI